MKVKDYKLVSATDINIFHTTVREYIKNNWQPLGSASISEGTYYQTLIRFAGETRGRKKASIKRGEINPEGDGA